MTTEDNTEALTYAANKPNVKALVEAFDRTANDLEFYFDQCRDSYDYRRNIWPGKSDDLRKHGPEAFPWDGAADNEAHVINERINRYIALFMSAMVRANIRAYPVEMGDLNRARTVSAFLKWMVASYIPGFKRQMELGANYLLERGLCVTYVGWQREDRTFKQTLTLDQLMALSPDIVRMILEKENDSQMIALLQQQFNNIPEKKAKRILNDLRKTGRAEFPIVRRSVDRPWVQVVAPDGDVLFPAYATDPQRAPYCFWRCLMTAQELRNKISSEGWDADWVEYVIENCKEAGDPLRLERRNQFTYTTVTYDASELYEVVYGYQRLIDEEDNSEGIYCTVFHREVYGKQETPDFAKFELMNGYEDYPFVVTKLSEDNKRLYDIQSVPELLKGIQWQVKTERDSRVDRNSLATMPPIMHPVGNAPSDWGPGRYVPYRRAGEFQFGPTPPYNPGSVEMEQTMLAQADKILGLDVGNPLSGVQQQYFVDKFLNHVRDVLRLAYKCFQRFGPDEVFFRVTGVSDPQRFNKGDPNENFDIIINYDVLQNDPESVEAQLAQFANLLQLDRNGRMDVDMLLELGAASINPVVADAILRPAGQAQDQITKQVTDDLSKIYAGIEVGARPNGAQIALQVIQSYTQQPDVMQRLQSDQAFQARFQKYVQQYQFQMTQQQNAQIGRIGTAPAAMGQTNTQTMQQTPTA
jgi:hypothetical protein